MSALAPLFRSESRNALTGIETGFLNDVFAVAPEPSESRNALTGIETKSASVNPSDAIV